MPLVVQQFERPRAEVIAALLELPTTTLSDAMGRRGGMAATVQPTLPTMRMAGPAFTVKPFPADNLTVHLALKFARPGDVLVIDSSGLGNIAHWGELTSRAASLRGWQVWLPMAQSVTDWELLSWASQCFLVAGCPLERSKQPLVQLITRFHAAD